MATLRTETRTAVATCVMSESEEDDEEDDCPLSLSMIDCLSVPLLDNGFNNNNDDSPL